MKKKSLERLQKSLERQMKKRKLERLQKSLKRQMKKRRLSQPLAPKTSLKRLPSLRRLTSLQRLKPRARRCWQLLPRQLGMI
jgi:hypothetical protein